MFFQGFSYRDSQITLLSSRKHFFFKRFYFRTKPYVCPFGMQRMASEEARQKMPPATHPYQKYNTNNKSVPNIIPP
jgi:hypothetical protein